MNRSLAVSLLMMGSLGIVAQVLILRELLVVFQGNELTVGIILANWMLSEALGSFVASKLCSRGYGQGAYRMAFAVFAVLLPFCWCAARALPEVAGLGAESFTLPQIFLMSLMVLAPVAVPHGMLFAFGCAALCAGAEERHASSFPRVVYLLDVLGLLAGGLGLNYLLLPFVGDAAIVWGASIAGTLAAAFAIRRGGGMTVGCGMLAVAVGWLLFSGTAERLASRAAAAQYPGQKMVCFTHTLYGNIAVTRIEEQQTVFLNRRAAITSPVPDVTEVEEFAHLPIVCRRAVPTSALVLAGGVGGVLAELEKYPDLKIVNTEVDPRLFTILRRFPTPFTDAELQHKNLVTKEVDSCRYVKSASATFDVIYLPRTLPADLLASRLCTVEFHRRIASLLSPDGIAICALPFSLVAPESHLRHAASCLWSTVRQVYPQVRVVPGDDRVYFLCSKGAALESMSPALAEAAAARLPPGLLVMIPPQVAYLFQESRSAQLGVWLAGNGKAPVDTPTVNTDFRPVLLKDTIAHWRRLSGASSGAGLPSDSWGVLWRLGLAALLLAAPVCVLRRSRGSFAIGWCVATTGFAGMACQLFIIFAFQVMYGYLFYEIGLLVAAFMCGSAAGALLSGGARGEVTATLPAVEIASACALGLCALVLCLCHEVILGGGALSKAMVVVSCALPGMMVGAQYPVALAAWRRAGGGERPGVVYGLDLLGSCVAGWLAGLVLLPCLGLYVSIGFLVSLKILGACVAAIGLRLSPAASSGDIVV